MSSVSKVETELSVELFWYFNATICGYNHMTCAMSTSQIQKPFVSTSIFPLYHQHQWLRGIKPRIWGGRSPTCCQIMWVDCIEDKTLISHRCEHITVYWQLWGFQTLTSPYLTLILDLPMPLNISMYLGATT